ncbi:phosphatidylserine synthase [Ensifer sp. ENS10]|uniref:phospholipase D-like domain-containing protein n=1 Tax=Ensifer sp. ENS10 TaxID=2769286 RepID=UPI00177C1F0C|nr:phospholipase D-like domain-containing protein [Ensifer sp. ENS10]MBD9509919.1 phosphatidylserine synthase [Ensifer sp. ENS10]
MLIAVPIFRLSCRVTIDKGRAWSVVEEAILWAVSQNSASVADLVAASGLKKQVIVAALSRLMRFRLVELTVVGGAARFVASNYGRDAITGGKPLPFFPKKEPKRVGFVIERVTGEYFPQGQVRVASRSGLEADSDPDKRMIVVEGGGPVISHEANLARLAQIAVNGYDEQLANVDGRTASMRSEFMLVRVIDGVIRNLPEGASDKLRGIIERVAALPSANATVPVTYEGPSAEIEEPVTSHSIEFQPEDLIVGAKNQKELLIQLISSAKSRMIIHSTFLDHKRFRELLPEIRSACVRGVTFDLLWGAEKLGDDEEIKNALSAVEIARIVREDADIGRRFRVHMKSTGSHAKLLLADNEDGDWLAAVGSCNWLSSPFLAVELTVVLRTQSVVADVAVALQRMAGRRALSDDIATEMSFLARDLKSRKSPSGNGTATLILGDHHDVVMRTGSGMAVRKVLAGSNRLGSTARPGFIIQAEAALERLSGLDVTLLYTIASGPLRKRHARTLAEEAADNGFRLVRLEKPLLHGKFLSWDDDDVAITSLNWGSSRTPDDFPEAEIGVHINCPGIARDLMQRIESIYPEIGHESYHPVETA